MEIFLDAGAVMLHRDRIFISSCCWLCMLLFCFYFLENQLGFIFGDEYCSNAPLANILKLEAAGKETCRGWRYRVVQSHAELTIGLFPIDVLSNADPLIGVKSLLYIRYRLYGPYDMGK